MYYCTIVIGRSPACAGRSNGGNIGRSSNGRTHPSGGCYLGPNPSLPALRQAQCFKILCYNKNMTKKFDSLASADVISKTEKRLTRKGFLSETAATGAEALQRIKKLIPAGASIMNGSSRTLEEIGFVKYLKEGKHNWKNLHKIILEEKGTEKQALLHKQSVLSDYYLGSVHALTENGELVIASNSGSQLPHLAFTSPNIILIVGTQKITSNLDGALKRLNEYVFPLEDARMKNVGMGGSFISKLLILNREPSFMGRKVHIILVNEKVGF